MNINLTLIVQTLVFIVLIWFTMKVVWPMILTPMKEREDKIAAGLAAAEKGQADLAQANSKSEAIIREARERATQIIDHAQHRANELVEQAKATATQEGQRLVAREPPAHDILPIRRMHRQFPDVVASAARSAQCRARADASQRAP